jgi:hypothetical protein
LAVEKVGLHAGGLEGQAVGAVGGGVVIAGELEAGIGAVGI